MEKGYAYVSSSVILTFFYGAIVPQGYFVTFVGVSLFYWVSKVMLIHSQSVASHPSLELSQMMTHTLQYIPLIHSFQHCIFSFVLSGRWSVISFFSFFLAVLFNLLPNDHIAEWLWQLKEQDEKARYNYRNFQQDYDRLNPATKTQAIQQWLNKKTKKKQIVVKSGDLQNQLNTIKNILHRKELQFVFIQQGEDSQEQEAVPTADLSITLQESL